MGLIWWAFGWRNARGGAVRVLHQLPVTVLLDRWRIPALGLAVYLAGGVALIRREKYFAGGLFLSYTTLLRIFPVFVFIGPVMVLVQEYLKTRKLDRRYLSIVAGAGAGRGGAGAISLVKSGASKATFTSSRTPRSTRRRRSPTTWVCVP